jgi:hypothetical protein
MLQHSGQSQIFCTFESLGICPSKVHLCPTMIVVSTARTNLVVDTVTLTFLSHWSMWLSTIQCSHIKRLIPRFSAMVSYESYEPSALWYHILTNWTGTSSINRDICSGISSCRMKAMSPWHTKHRTVQAMVDHKPHSGLVHPNSWTMVLDWTMAALITVTLILRYIY